MFFDNFNAICKAKHTTPTAVVKLLGLSSSKVTAWKNGSLPKEDVIQMLADKLGVDVTVFFNDNTAHTQDTNSVDEEVVVYCRNGKTIRKKLTKEQMDYLDKFINSFSAEDYPDL